MGGISADDDLAVEKLTKKLEGLESQQALSLIHISMCIRDSGRCVQAPGRALYKNRGI